MTAPTPEGAREWSARHTDPVSGSMEIPDAELIAAARNALPELIRAGRDRDGARNAIQRIAEHRRRVITERDAARAEVERLRELIAELYDDGPCQYDHHDQCQGHNLHRRPCPHGRAAQLLAEGGDPASAPADATGPDLAGWCERTAAEYAEMEHHGMDLLGGDARDAALVEWTVRVLGNASLRESREVVRVLAERHGLLDEADRLAREATAADGRWLAVWSITGPVERVVEQARIALAQMAGEYADAGLVKLRAELRADAVDAADGGDPR